MQPTDIESTPAESTTIPAPTRTETTHHTDQQSAASVFFSGRSAGISSGHVEEDSTDIYVLERCSPLNDF